jgi:hypothetical protein
MYYNQFNENKNYKQLLFSASKYVQSSELNEMQSIAHNEQKILNDAIFEDGNILDGGEVALVGKTVNLNRAIIYYDGYGINIEPTQFDISLTDIIIIGVSILERIITADEDSALLNPAVGTPSYREKGADRFQVTGYWTVATNQEDEKFYPIYTFVDGILQTIKRIAPELDGARQIVARYDKDSNGSYVVNGLETAYDMNDELKQEYVLTISEGNGHVDGIELIYDYAQKVRVPYALDTKTVISEPHTFFDDGIYHARHKPIAKIDRVVGIKEVVENITHGSYSGAKDILSNTPVVEIISIVQGAMEYKKDTDFIQNGDFVEWLNGDEPSPSSTCEITYRYQTHLEDIDFIEDGLILNGFATGTAFSINYSYYLNRKDRLILTKDDGFKLLSGVPNEFEPIAPRNTIGLSLAVISVSYGKEPLIELDMTKIMKVGEIQRLYDKVEAIAYNQAKLSLDDRARNSDPTLIAKEIYSDPFFNEIMRDAGLEQNAIIVDEELRPNIELKKTDFSSISDIYLPSTLGVSIINQDWRTHSRKINEFIEHPEPLSDITLTPATFRWIVRTSFYWSWWSSGTSISATSSAIIPSTKLNIKAKTFKMNEKVTVYVDGKKAGVLPTIQIKDDQYRVDGTVTTPGGIRSGNKLIEVVGNESGIVVKGVWSTIPLQRNIWRRIWRDPLAQTISFEKDTFVNNIALYIEKMPTTWISITVTKTTVGIPDMAQTVYTQNYNIDDIGVDYIGWHTFNFDIPLLLEGNSEYAIVVECGDSTGELGIARLGNYDNDKKEWLTKQPYDGVLLSSANSSTWTAYQREDMSIIIKKSIFDDKYTKSIGTFTVKDVTDLYLMAVTDIYIGTAVEFFVVLKDKNNEEIAISPMTLLSIENYTGEIELKAVLSTTDNKFTPIIDKDISILSGKVSTLSAYIGREFKVSGERINIYLEAIEQNEAVKVYIQKDDEWVQLERETFRNELMGDGWVELYFLIDNLDIQKTRIKIELESADTARPRVRKLRGVVS